MSTQTEHLHLDLREASDIFNSMSTNANFESLDNIIYEIQTKGGVPTYTTTAAANLLKLSQNPTPNVTVFKFVAAGDANTWSYQETVNDIVALDGTKKTVKGGEMYVAWVNSANAMVVIAWPDVVNAQTFDGKGPAEWASKAQLDAVNQTAANATTTAQAAATVANNALEVAQAAGMKFEEVYTTPENSSSGGVVNIAPSFTPKMLLVIGKYNSGTYYNANLLPWEFGKKFACSAFGAEMNYELKGRYITITNGTTLTLSNGYTWNNANSTTKEDVFACVPYKIYAIG